MGDSKETKKLKEEMQKLLEQDKKFQEELAKNNIEMAKMRAELDTMSPDPYKNVNENYEEFKKKCGCPPPIPSPHVCDDPNAHYDEVAAKCICNHGYVLDSVTGKCIESTGPVPVPTPTTEKDQYGINKIYADKPQGILIASTAFTEEEFTRNYASGKPSENSYECEYKDSNKLENEEVTFYTQINGFKKEPDTLSIKLLGNKHSDGSKDKWLIFQIDTDGKPDDNFQIEDPHPNNTDNHQKTLFDIGQSIIGKPIGVKAITFIDESDKRHAETWVDFPTNFEKPTNNWKKYIDIKDVVKDCKKGFLNATNGGALLRIDGTKKGDMPTTKFMSIREIVPTLAGAGQGSTIPPVVPPVEPPVTPPPVGAGTLDKDGILIPYTMTGKSVALTEGNDHRNGQRYSINHKFENYYMVGYFKLGKGQEQIEMKTDGPNHGSCTKLPQCCWVEADLAVMDRTNQEGMKFKPGQSFLSSEFPHPVNHSPPKDQVMPIIEGIKPQQWLGFSVAAYWDNGFRHIELRADPTPFDASGKPQNTWKMGVNDIDKGQITTPELAKRKMAVDYDQGLECEIRMHKGTNHDCEIKLAKVYEIIPPV